MKRLRFFQMTLVAGFALAAAALTLSHTFSAPNGLGVNGGRAALWYLARGVPDGFWTAPAFETFQPSYPPGLALLTLGVFVLTGGPSEWAVQLLGTLPFVLCLALLLRKARRLDGGVAWAASLWLFALFFNGTVLNMASLFYSEGWMLLCILGGLSALDADDRPAPRATWRGWLFVGLSGLFKNEGILFTALLFAARAIETRRTLRDAPAFLAGLAPALAWLAITRALGASLPDYAPLWAPDGARLLAAAGEILRRAFLAPWETAFAFYLVPALAWRARRPAPALFLLLCLPAFAWIYSLSRADLGWHLWSSLPRLLWCAAAAAVFDAAAAQTRWTPRAAPPIRDAIGLVEHRLGRPSPGRIASGKMASRIEQKGDDADRFDAEFVFPRFFESARHDEIDFATDVPLVIPPPLEGFHHADVHGAAPRNEFFVKNVFHIRALSESQDHFRSRWKITEVESFLPFLAASGPVVPYAVPFYGIHIFETSVLFAMGKADETLAGQGFREGTFQKRPFWKPKFVVFRSAPVIVSIAFRAAHPRMPPRVRARNASGSIFKRNSFAPIIT